MAQQLTNYKCPSCGGPLRFDGESGKLVCDHCGSKYETAEMEALYSKKDEDAARAFEEEAKKKESSKWDTSGFKDWNADKIKAYNCPSCGAELILDETTAASSCPYCGNPTLIAGQLSGLYKPDFIIPFKLDKEAAKEALKNHYKGKPFLPKSFANQNHIEDIKGVYVPFWMFDGEAVGDVRYEATISDRYRRGDYEVTETRHFDVYRSGSCSFEKIPVDASSKMSDDHMDSIEPYNYDELKDYSNAYLPGFEAMKYDVDVENCRERADARCRETLESALKSTVRGYQTVTKVGGSVYLNRGKVHYALLPVWMLNTKWQGKDFLFAMNGQTGRLIGDLPVSWGKFWGMFGIIAALFFVIISIIYMLTTG